MKIASRLQIQALFSVLILAVISVTTFSLTSRLIHTGSHLAENVIPSIETFNKAYSAFLNERTAALMYVISNDEASRELALRNFEEAKGDAMREASAYERYLETDRDRDILMQFQSGIKKQSELYVAAIAAAKAGDNARAQELLVASKADFLAIQKLASDQLLHKAQVADADKQALKDSGDLTIKLTLGLSLLGMVLLLLFIWRTYYRVSSSLNNASSCFSKLTRDLDLSSRCDASQSDEIGEMLRHFNEFVARLQSSMQKINDSSAKLSEASLALADAASQVSEGSNAQSESASSMAAALEEMTVSINHVADRTGEASSLAQDTRSKAEEGERVIHGTGQNISQIAGSVRKVSGNMETLSARANEINSVVSVIKDVADQTNLLALNAAIEAARAGEQGRGFAVVADEVRKLAERTAQSTSEINSMVQTIQSSSQQANEGVSLAVDNVDTGVHAADAALGTIQRIAQSASQSRELVGEIAAAIREQSQAANSISQQVENVARMSEENANAAHQVNLLTGELKRLASSMNSEVGHYKI